MVLPASTQGLSSNWPAATWLKKCWQPFLEHSLAIQEVYWTESGFILSSDYRENFHDNYYIMDSMGTPGTRADYCFQNSEEDIFVLKSDAKEYAKEKLDDMFIQRQKSLIKEYNEAKKAWEL